MASGVKALTAFSFRSLLSRMLISTPSISILVDCRALAFPKRGDPDNNSPSRTLPESKTSPRAADRPRDAALTLKGSLGYAILDHASELHVFEMI